MTLIHRAQFIFTRVVIRHEQLRSQRARGVVPAVREVRAAQTNHFNVQGWVHAVFRRTDDVPQSIDAGALGAQRLSALRAARAAVARPPRRARGRPIITRVQLRQRHILIHIHPNFLAMGTPPPSDL